MKSDYEKGMYKQLEEATELIKQLQEELQAAKLLIAQQAKRIAELEEKVGKNSGNSSVPPSRDFFNKPTNMRHQSGKKSGGQKGHKPHNAELLDKPNEIIEHRIEKCKCGGEIKQFRKYKAKQYIDIEIMTKVTEHRIFAGECTCCGKKVKAKCNLRARITYGGKLKALAAMLSFEGNVSLNRTKSMISELTNRVNLSEGTLVNWHNELKRKTEPFLAKIKAELLASDVNHKDETGIRINGKIRWFHVLSNKDVTLYFPHKKRGKEADDEMGVLENYGGTLMHDHFKPLYKFKCKHAECNAHILRYLKSVIENQEREWAQEMMFFLKELLRAKKRGKNIDVKRAFEEYDAILRKARSIYYEKSEGEDFKLWRRMSEYKQEHLRFICDESVPFDNNQAERDLRMVKAKTKISGCFRSDQGAQAFANAKSYTSTLRKSGQNIYASLLSAFHGNPACFV